MTGDWRRFPVRIVASARRCFQQGSCSLRANAPDDGATILKLLDVVHPAARTLVDIARAQDAEVGDGTTSVTLL